MRALSPPLALAFCAIPALAQPAVPSPLAGTWRVAAAGPSKGHAADWGELKVDATGAYQWSENRQLAGLGALTAIHPSSGARGGQECWLFHRGKGDLYAFKDGDALEIYDAASNTLVGRAAKGAAKRR